MEVIGSPVFLRSPDQGLVADLGGEVEFSRAIGVKEAAGLLHNRWVT